MIVDVRSLQTFFFQVKKLRDMPFRELIFDVWSLNDLFTSILFLTVIGLKVHNVTYYTPNLDPHFCPAVNMSQSYQQKVLHSLKLEGEEFEVSFFQLI